MKTRAKPPSTWFLTLSCILLAAGCGLAEPASEANLEAPGALPAVVRELRLDVRRDCGARGDGRTNDTAAFQSAAKRIEANGGGTLIIPKGVYIVGKQVHRPGQFPYYQAETIFEVRGLNGLLIEGNGATLRIAPGLRFGSFDKNTGEVHNPVMPFVDSDYRVDIGNMIGVRDSRNVVIRNLELDGNSDEVILGGTYGDTGRQVQDTGLNLTNNSHVLVRNLHSHHQALDGMLIAVDLKESDPATPHTLIDCRLEYNGRQGLSWTGGRGLKAIGCKFNHTGRVRVGEVVLASAPGAGLDIEAEGSVCRDGYFENCEFVNNTGAGMVADSGDGGYSRFVNCTFWGTTSWSAWSKKPGLLYEDCRFYGSAVHAVGDANPSLATRWRRCHFEDKPWQDGKVYRQNTRSFLVELNGPLQNVKFEDCSFTANTCKSFWIHADPAGMVELDGCSITHRKSDVPDEEFQALFRYVTVKNTRFREEFPADITRNWYIVTENIDVGDEVIVDGPRVRWFRPEIGPVGSIPRTAPAPQTP